MYKATPGFHKNGAILRNLSYEWAKCCTENKYLTRKLGDSSYAGTTSHIIPGSRSRHFHQRAVCLIFLLKHSKNRRIAWYQCTYIMISWIRILTQLASITANRRWYVENNLTYSPPCSLTQQCRLQAVLHS